MPGFDGTGPEGKGPMTGRAMGNCVLPADKVPDTVGQEPFRLKEQFVERRGFSRCGRGRGGRGGRHRYRCWWNN
jgi:hypothetical protein